MFMMDKEASYMWQKFFWSPQLRPALRQYSVSCQYSSNGSFSVAMLVEAQKTPLTSILYQGIEYIQLCLRANYTAYWHGTFMSPSPLLIPTFHIKLTLTSFIHSFIPLACAECDYSLPFSGASSIPLCYILFPATPLSPHLAIYFLAYLSTSLFPNSYIISFWNSISFHSLYMPKPT